MEFKEKDWLDENIDISLNKCLDKFFNKNYPNSPKNLFYKKILAYFSNNDYYHLNPWTVKLLVTSKCNFRCKHCFFYGSDFYDSKDDLNHSEMMNLVSDIITDLKPVEVVISGGEPFLREDFFEILSKFKSSNICLYIQTNASLLDSKRVEKLKNILNPKCDVIQVSLDGFSSDVHNFVRNGDVYEKTICGIKELARKFIPFSINCTVTSKNQYDLPELFKFASSLGAKFFVLNKFIPFHNDQMDLVPDEEVIIKATSRIIDMAENSQTDFILNLYKFKDLININKFKCKIDEREELFTQTEITESDCNCHKHEAISIMSNADVALCAMAYFFGFSIGNAKQQRLINIWKNRFNNSTFQKRDPNKMKCKECKYFRICKGGCPIYAYAVYNDFHAPDGECNYCKSN